MIKIISIPKFDADVLIVGAGPAGASLAVHLRRQGVDVILIEAEKFPRDKVCGDFVGPVALNELEGLGIGNQFKGSNRIDRSAVFLDGRQLVEQSFPSIEGMADYGKVIPRLSLDNIIFSAAMSVGVRTIEQCRLINYTVYPTHIEAECNVNNNSHYIIAKLIIGADGSNSTIARILHGTRHPEKSKILAVRAYYRDTTGPSNRADLYFSEDSFPGYCWFFPTGPSTANIGVGMLQDTMPAGEKHLKEMMEDLIVSDASLHSRMANAKITGKVGSWPLSIYDPDLEYVADRVLLTGDAGGLINALNGEGIQYALLSGRWASITIQKALAADDLGKESLSDFCDRVNSSIGYDLALSRAIIQLLRNRNLNPLWIQVLRLIIERASVDRDYAETAGGVLAGVVPANKVIHPAFISKTVMQAGFHFGIQGMHTLLGGINAWQSFASDMLKLGLDVSGDAMHNKEAYRKWTINLVKDLSRLAKFTLTDLKFLSK